jgi:hypothetical protein
MNSTLESISDRHGIPTRPIHVSSTSKTKREWVVGDGRMKKLARADY